MSNQCLFAPVPRAGRSDKKRPKSIVYGTHKSSFVPSLKVWILFEIYRGMLGEGDLVAAATLRGVKILIGLLKERLPLAKLS